MTIPEANILGKFTDSKFRQFRQVAIQAIRSTDISFNIQMRAKLTEMGLKLINPEGVDKNGRRKSGSKGSFNREELVASKTARELMWGALVRIVFFFFFSIWFFSFDGRFSQIWF